MSDYIRENFYGTENYDTKYFQKNLEYSLDDKLEINDILTNSNNSKIKSELISEKFQFNKKHEDDIATNTTPKYSINDLISLKNEGILTKFMNSFENINNINKKVILSPRKKIFTIIKGRKLNCAKGRCPKNSGITGFHNRLSRDNIIRKFKAHFIRNIIDYINSQFIVNKDKPENKIKKILLRNAASQGREISQKKNLQWINSTLKDIISSNISEKYSIKNIDYNERKIKKIYNQGKEIEVIKLLNKNVGEILNLYRQDSDIKRFKQLKDVVKEFKIRKEPEEFIIKYLYVAMNFENIFKNEIKPRNKKTV